MSTINKNAPFMELPLGISRQVGAPIERFEVFYSFEEAQNYAKTNPLAYVGQTIKVVLEKEKTVNLYNIGFDGALEKGAGEFITLSEVEAKNIIDKYLK